MTFNSIENQEKIINLKNGDVFEGKLLIDKIDFALTRSGKPYTSVDFRDDTSSINGKVWDVGKEDFEFKTEEVVFVRAEVELYANNTQFKILELIPLKEGDPDQNPYIFLKRAPLSEMELKIEMQRFLKIIEEENKNYSNIIKYILKKDSSDMMNNTFLKQPAAKAVHHNYMGGLAYHTYRMLKHAEVLIEVYPHLNKGLLLTGTFLHDIAKLVELTGVIDTEYSIRGALLGHIVIADSWICEATKVLGLNPERDEEIVLLRHLILSHHGKTEYGSPIVPKIPEATALHSIDKLDADITQYEDAFLATEPGEKTSRIFGLGVEAYKVKGDNHILD